MAFLYKPLSNSSNTPQIRMLKLLPAEEPLDAVHCQLIVVAVHDCSPYEALSYCWGNTTRNHTVHCNGLPLQVTQNLFLALQHLRSTQSPRTLWVDSICINQDDIGERSHQVLLMHDIFKRADRVISWIGPAAMDSELGLQALTKCVNLYPKLWSQFQTDAWGAMRFGPLEKILRRSDSNQTSTSGSGDCDHSGVALSQAELKAIRGLLERPYWTRLWVVQEICVASSITVMCGYITIPANDFQCACMVALGCGGLLAEVGFPPWLSCVVSLARLRQDSQSVPNKIVHSVREKHITSEAASVEEAAATLETNLHRIIDLGSTFQCSDARDKVYALLGLATTHVNHVPDYSSSIKQCYQDFTRAMLEEMGNLDLFTIFTANYTFRSDIQHASWVPNLAFDRTTWLHDSWGPNNPFKHQMAIALLVSGVVRLTERSNDRDSPRFSASGPADRAEYGFNDSVLSLMGHVTDTISAVSPSLDCELDGDDDESWDLAFGETPQNVSFFFQVRRFTQICVRTSCWVEALMRWEDMAMSDANRPTREELHTFCRVAQMAHPSADMSAFADMHEQTWRPVLRCLRWLVPLKIFGERRTLNVYHLIAGLISFIAATNSTTKAHLILLIDKALAGYKLARTQNGRLALVSIRVQEGDKIVLLAGGKTPYVIRPRMDGWEFLGTCYVDGIMLGEDWRQEAVQRIKLF